MAAVDESTCTCAGCRGLFARPAAFDAHRRRGVCLTPLEAGLVPVRGRPGCWDTAPQPLLPLTSVLSPR